VVGSRMRPTRRLRVQPGRPPRAPTTAPSSCPARSRGSRRTKWPARSLSA